MTTWLAEEQAWALAQRPRRQRAVRIMALLLALLATCGGIVATTVNGSHTASKTTSTCGGADQQFAGYVTAKTTVQISAQWTVPQIEQTERFADASTWIGVQSRTQSFVQVGTTENEVDTVSNYQVFWSDPRVGFLAQDLMVVSAGDTVTASMQQDASGWTLRVTDTTAGRVARHRVEYAGNVQFRQAEWLQEDPGSACQGNAPYPRTSTVAFSQLQDDGVAPTMSYDDGQVLLAADGIALVPTPIQDDGFILQLPTGLQARYLRTIAAYDIAIARVEPCSTATGPDAGKSPPPSVMVPMERALRQADRRLDATTWPTTLQPKLRLLAARNERLLEDLEHSTVRSALVKFSQTTANSPTVANSIRYALGLPPTEPASIARDQGWS